MAARQIYSAESLAAASTTSSTFQTKNSLIFTPDASSNYLLLHSGFFRNATGILNTSALKLRNVTGASDLALSQRCSYNTANWLPFGGISRFTSGASPVSTTFAHQYASQNAGDTTGIRDSRIIALKLGANDQYIESLAESSNGTTMFSMKTQLMWTALNGFYLILASAEVSNDNASSASQVQISHDLVNYGTSILDPQTAGDYMGWGFVGKFFIMGGTLTSFDINYASVNTNTAKIRNARICALWLGDFEADYYSEDRTRATLANTTSYTDRLVYTPATYNLNHLTIASAVPDSNTQTATSNVYAQFIQGSTTVGEGIIRPATNRNYAMPIFVAKYGGVTSGDTYKFQLKTDASKTLAMDEQAISLLQTDTMPGATIAVPAGALTLAAQTPTIISTTVVAVPAGALVLNKPVPVVITSGIAIPAGALSLTAQTPNIITNIVVPVPAGALIATPQVPTFSTTPLPYATPYGILLSITRPPAVAVAIPAGSLTLSGLQASVVAGYSVSVPVGGLSANGQAPAISVGYAVAVPSSAMTLSGYGPNISIGAVVSVPAGSLSLSGYAPTYTMPVIVTMPPSGISITGQTPNVTRPVTVPMPAGSLVLNVFEAEATTGYTVQVPTGPLSFTGFAPNIYTQGTQVDMPVGALVIDGADPIIVAGFTIPVPSGAVSVQPNPPTVSIGSVVPVPVAGLAFSALTPLFAVGAVVSMGRGDLLLFSIAPDILTDYPDKIPSLERYEFIYEVDNTFFRVTSFNMVREAETVLESVIDSTQLREVQNIIEAREIEP